MVKTPYIGMDETLVDFTARLEGIDPVRRERYRGREDELPGLFPLMPRMPGAIETFTELSGLFDTYILATASWANPSSWQHKVEWVHVHLGMDRARPPIGGSSCPTTRTSVAGTSSSTTGRPTTAPTGTAGEVIALGSAQFPDWPTVVEYLRRRA